MLRTQEDRDWSLIDAVVTAKKVDVATCRGRCPVRLNKIFKFAKLWQAAIILRAYRRIDRELWKNQWQLMQVAADAQLPKHIKVHQCAIITIPSLQRMQESERESISISTNNCVHSGAEGSQSYQTNQREIRRPTCHQG